MTCNALSFVNFIFLIFLSLPSTFHKTSKFLNKTLQLLKSLRISRKVIVCKIKSFYLQQCKKLLFCSVHRIFKNLALLGIFIVIIFSCGFCMERGKYFLYFLLHENLQLWNAAISGLRLVYGCLALHRNLRKIFTFSSETRENLNLHSELIYFLSPRISVMK